MDDTTDTGGSSFAWGDLGTKASDLFFDFAKAKLANEARPKAPPPVPQPYRYGVSRYTPGPGLAAQQSDIAQQVGEIFASPRTWLALAAVALVVVLVKLRR